VSRREALAALFYWENWYRAFELGPRNMLTHTWSLSVEGQFYLVWPLVLIAGLRFAPRALLPLTVAAALASSVARARDCGTSTRQSASTTAPTFAATASSSGVRSRSSGRRRACGGPRGSSCC